jgi:single-strand DNA-binding protein
MAARSLNKVLLIGNLTRDPEIRYTASGAAVCSFGMATNRSWKDSEGEIKEEAEFHNLVAWNKMAEVCYQILAKGMKVYVEGELRTRSWEDETSGTTKYRTEIKLNEMILLDSKGKRGAGGGATETEEQPAANKEITVEDVMGETPADAAKADSGAEPKKEEKKTEKKAKKETSDEGVGDPLADDELPF